MLIGTIVYESLLLSTFLVIVICVLCINAWLFLVMKGKFLEESNLVSGTGQNNLNIK